MNVHGHVDPDQPNNVWWTGNNGGHHHYRFKPYNLVPANIFGIPGWAPENIGEHLEETFGPTWRQIDANATGVNDRNDRGGSGALKDFSFGDEWWAEVRDRFNASRTHLERASLLPYQGLGEPVDTATMYTDGLRNRGHHKVTRLQTELVVQRIHSRTACGTGIGSRKCRYGDSIRRLALNQGYQGAVRGLVPELAAPSYAPHGSKSLGHGTSGALKADQ